MRTLLSITTTLLLSAASFASISVSSPAANSTVTSPTAFKASASGATAMQIYVDNVLKAQVNSSTISTSLGLASGSHYVVFQAWYSNGSYAKSAETIKVSGSATSSSSTTSTSTTSGTLIDNIDQLTGWQSCDACAGAGGSGPTTAFSMKQFVGSPSTDGQAAQFWLGGSTPYSQALWWKQLGGRSASHFTYDLYFYYTNAGAPQALEFDMNQSIGGKKYIFGTQCNIRGGNHWDVWDTANAHWVNTGVGCPAPPTYKWNHLVEEFERTSDGHVHFIAITLNGQKFYINRYFWPPGSSVNELNVAVQLDGNYTETNYSVWVDKIRVYYY